MMVKDHAAANQELMALAQSKGLKLPKGPGMGADTTQASSKCSRARPSTSPTSRVR